MVEKLSDRIRDNIGAYFRFSFPPGFSILMSEVDEHETVAKSIRFDGYDLGILIPLQRFGGYHELDWINSRLISEVGWLDGGDKELLRRVSKLVDFGCLEIMTPQKDTPHDRYYMSMPKFRFVKFPKCD